MERSNGKACGICGKWFASWKAIGGHMRSHLVKLPIPPKLETNNQALDNSADLTQHPNQTASSLTFHPEEQQTQNFRSMKRNFSAFSANSNRENESVSYPKTPTRKRSKCHRKLNVAADTKDLPIDPDVMMLWGFYKDAQKWEEIKKQKIKETNKTKEKHIEGSRDDSIIQAHTQVSFKCQRCGKMFRSYQALCGHKAYCKSDNDGDFKDQKPFQCPYCNREFKTAQALGGHKRVHFSSANEFRSVSVDLNFPDPK